jgi:AraC-like DNA-binding protein
VALADATPIEEFWSHAPALFELANTVSDQLEFSDVSDTIREQVRELADAIPATPESLSDMDPYLRSALLTAVIHAMRAAEDRNRRELRITVERVRQALRDLLDERPVWRGGPKHAAMWLRQRGLSVGDLAELLGASETSVRRWASPDDETSPGGENADKVMVVAKVVNHLRHAMTVRGAVQWLQRSHPAFDDRRPIDELKDPDSYRRLIHIASGARSFVAT